MRITIAIVGMVLLAMPLSAQAEDAADTPASREAAAERYAKTTDMKAMLGQMADEMSRNVPAHLRDVFESAMKKHVRIDMIEAATKAALVKHFTAQELTALAEFYESPVGRSAMSKIAVYMADLQPLMIAEVQRAVAEAIKEQQAAEQVKPAGT
jgi:hypothetical protein